jgi:hypothetical protein
MLSYSNARLHDKFFKPGPTLLQLAGLKFQPLVGLGLKILSCNRFNPGLKFMSDLSMHSSSYRKKVFDFFEGVWEFFNFCIK